MVLEEFVGITPDFAIDWWVLAGSAAGALIAARLVAARLVAAASAVAGAQLGLSACRLVIDSVKTDAAPAPAAAAPSLDQRVDTPDAVEPFASLSTSLVGSA